jgi:O-antigen/teichoic acid export membrane protein
MEQVIVSKAAQIKDNIKQIMGTTTLLVAFLSVLATSLALLVSAIFGYARGLQILLFIAAIDLLLLFPLRITGLVFQLYLKQWYGAGIAIGRQLLWIVVLSVLILLKAGLPAIILGRLFCSASEALAIFFFSRRFVRFGWWHGNVSFARQIIRESWPMALSALAGSIYHRIDQVMLHTLVGDRQLGYYVPAVNISELFSIFPIALMSTMLPILSKIILEKERFQRYLTFAFRYLMILVFGISTVVTLGSSVIITFLYGQQYSASSLFLSILIWSEAGVFLGVIICNALIAKGLQKLILLSTSLGAVINVALNLLLIPKWGIIGAAWATVISYNIAGIIAFLFIPASRSLAFNGIKISIYPFLAALFCIITLFYFPRLVSITLAPILYVVVLFILKVWDENDSRLILNALRSIRAGFNY